MTEQIANSSKLRTAAKVCIIGIVLPCSILLIMELLANIAGLGYPSTFFIKENAIDGNKYLRANYRVGYRFFPAQIARKPLPEIMPASKPTGRLRIFVLGESAARGEQLADFSFARMLEAALQCSGQQNGQQQKAVEVINTGIPAINSWVLREFAKEIVNYQPDLIIVYAGHNEFIGPYGPASVFGLTQNRNAALSGIWASSLRLIQALKPAALPKSLAQGWKGLEMFIKNSIAPGNKAIDTCLNNWRANLNDIFAVAAAAKIPVIWCRVPVNQLDCPPFISDESGLSPEAIAVFDQIKKDSENNDYQSVLRNIDKIRNAVPAHALVSYLEGRARIGLEQTEAAKQCFKQAIANDCFRVRTTDLFNDAGFELAKQHGVVVAEVEEAFAKAGKNGIIGNNLIYDHVHLTLEGHYLAAASIFSAIKTLNAEFVKMLPAKFPDLAEIKRITGYSNQDAIDNLLHIISSLQSPPFTYQFRHQTRLDELNGELETLKKNSTDLFESAALTRAALALQPFNAAIYHRLAMLCRNDPYEAKKNFEQSIALNPFNIDALNNFGLLLMAQKSDIEAEKIFQRSLAIAPDFARAHYNLGIIYAGRELAANSTINRQKAIEHYKSAIQADPGMENAWRNLANLHFRAGDFNDAMTTYQQAMQAGFSDIHFALGAGNCLMQLQQTNQALAAYEQAVASFPLSALPLYGLGQACEKLQKFSEAGTSFLKATELGHLPATYRIFELYFAQKFPLTSQQVAELSEKACQITDFADPWLMQILASSYMNTGKKTEAAGILHRALNLAVSQGKTELASEIEANIKLTTSE